MQRRGELSSFRRGHVPKARSEKVRTQRVPLPRGQLFFLGKLQMRWLRLDQAFLIDDRPAAIGEESHIDAQTQQGKEIEGFLGRNRVRIAKDSVGAADLVDDEPRPLLHQLLPGILLVLDHLCDHLMHPLEDLLLAFSKRHLIRNLEEISQRLGPLPVETPHGEADPVDRLYDLADLLAKDEPGEMHHRRRPQSRADVGRTGGEVAQLGGKGELELLVELRVGFVRDSPGGLQLESPFEGLNAKMIFLIDHQADRSSAVDHDPAAGVAARMLPADQMLFHQDLFFHRGEVIHRVAKNSLLHSGQSHRRGQSQGQDLLPFGSSGPTGEGETAEISSEPDAARENDAAALLSGMEPLARKLQKRLNLTLQIISP